MKMKKLLWVLPAFAAVATLASCGSAGSSKISYVDEEGNKQTVDVKPTEDSDAVVETLYAMTKQEVSKPKEVTVAAKVNAEVAATTADSKKVNYSANLDAKLQLAADLNAKTAEDLVNSLGAYAHIKLDATAPSLEILGSETPDFTKTYKYALDAEAFVEATQIYAYFNKIDLPKVPVTEETKEMASVVNAVVPMLKTSVLSFNFGSYLTAEVADQIDSVLPMLNDKICIYDIVKTQTEEFDDAKFKAQLAAGVEAAGISIKAVSGSVVTFNFAVDPNAKPGDELKSYKVGQVVAPKSVVSVDVAVDVQKVLPKSISVDLASALTNAFEAPKGFTAFEFSKASVSVNFSYNESVKKIAASKTTDTVDVTEIISMFGD